MTASSSASEVSAGRFDEQNRCLNTAATHSAFANLMATSVYLDFPADVPKTKPVLDFNGEPRTTALGLPETISQRIPPPAEFPPFGGNPTPPAGGIPPPAEFPPCA